MHTYATKHLWVCFCAHNVGCGVYVTYCLNAFGCNSICMRSRLNAYKTHKFIVYINLKSSKVPAHKFLWELESSRKSENNLIFIKAITKCAVAVGFTCITEKCNYLIFAFISRVHTANVPPTLHICIFYFQQIFLSLYLIILYVLRTNYAHLLLWV